MAHALFSAFVTGSDLLCSRLIHDVAHRYSNGPTAQMKAVAHQGGRSARGTRIFFLAVLQYLPEGSV